MENTVSNVGDVSAYKTQLPLLKRLCWDYHVIAIQPVHWRADCCLFADHIENTSTALLTASVCWTVYRAVAWQRVHQICYNIVTQMPIARQLLGKHIPATQALNNRRTSIAR
jgi:hypothetical protein